MVLFQLDLWHFHNQGIVVMPTVIAAVGSLWANGNRMEGSLDEEGEDKRTNVPFWLEPQLQLLDKFSLTTETYATSANEKLQAPFFHLSAVFLSKVQSIVTICCNAVSFLCLLFTTAMKNIRRAAASKKLCNKTDFYRQPDVLCGTSKTSSCRYFQNSSMQNMFCSFLTNLFSS